MKYYNLLKQVTGKNFRFVRLAFLFTFLIRFLFVIFFFGGFVSYFEVNFMTRLVHYFTIFFFTSIVTAILGRRSYYYFFLLLKKVLFFSIDNKKLYRLNKLVLLIIGKIMLFFIRIVSFNYFIATILFFLASFFKFELMFELVLLALFFRFLYHFIQVGPDFLTVEQALNFYSKVMIGRYVNEYPYQYLLKNSNFKLALLPAPVIALRFSANIIVFRPFLALFSTIALAVFHKIGPNDYRKQIFYSRFLYYDFFRIQHSFSIVDDLDFSISYFYVLTFKLFNDRIK
jgi:hypothetical protein